MTAGKTTSIVATNMGLSPYQFKKAGWEIIPHEDSLYQLLLSFYVVSPGDRINNQFVINGPFTEHELEKRRAKGLKELTDQGRVQVTPSKEKAKSPIKKRARRGLIRRKSR